MAEKTDMADRVLNDVSGKWEKTGKTTEKTTYTLQDLMLEKLVFLGDNKFRDLVGKDVNIQLDVKYNNFTRATQVSLKNISAV